MSTPNSSIENSGAPVLPDKKPASSTAIADEPVTPAVTDVLVTALFVDTTFEAIYNIEASDFATLMQPAEFYTLQSMTASLPESTQLIHAMIQVGHSPKPTAHAERDGLSTFKLGLAVAEAWNISNYQGIILGCLLYTSDAADVYSV